MARTHNKITGADSLPASLFERRGLRRRALVVESQGRHHGGAAVAQFCRSLKGITMRRHAGIATTLALLVLLVSAGGKCSINERKPSWHDSMRSRATLECRAPPSGRSIMSLFSFSVGGSVSDPRQSDLCFYFDSDDCAGGALVGHHDEKGWLFPIGKRDWRELQREEPQPSEVDSIAAITAITTAQEGVAFWAKTVDGRYALLRIAKVQPSSYDAIRDGKQASIEFEWMW